MKPEQKEFLEEIQQGYRQMYKILMKWEKLSTKDSDAISDGYPFQHSFDEWIWEYNSWVEKVRNKFNYHLFSPTITVGQMKEILKEYEDDVQIVVADTDNAWWFNITEVEIPDDDTMFTLTLHTENNFSITQLGDKYDIK